VDSIRLQMQVAWPPKFRYFWRFHWSQLLWGWRKSNSEKVETPFQSLERNATNFPQLSWLHSTSKNNYSS
jgi:hypothetical protein